ncbi:MAG: sodium/solute symporter [Verrucomicrobiota bacterium JB023]|nr:sodium/solute symporter [Verrucomicrobiota bacterium JB023]
MNAVDWGIFVAYLAGMIGLSLWLAKRQKTADDYYVGGRNLSWWAVGISIVATQSSAISFVSIPAFVAVREGGGLSWLQYELGVPLAMLFLLLVLIPRLREKKLVSVYEFLRTRFGVGTGKTLAGVFLLSRGLATAVGVYATGLVLAPMLQWPVWAAILLIGVTAVIYDAIGGLKAVVVSDVIQMGLIFGGVAMGIALALGEVGGWGAAWAALEAERKTAADWSSGVGDTDGVPFWAFLVGGLFLYISYYGTDQSQVQRLLGTKSVKEAQKAVLLGGSLRLPLTLMYVGLGVALAALLQESAIFQGQMEGQKPDLLVPVFILEFVPTGLKGLLLAATVAAAMSSLDSALNALSAVTVKDFLSEGDGGTPLWRERLVTIAWGTAVTLMALGAGSLAKTVIEAINKVGSAFYGPVLVAFLLGLGRSHVKGIAMSWGVVAGVGLNLALWLLQAPLHWMWWNLLGAAVAWLVAELLSRKADAEGETTLGLYWNRPAVVILSAVFLVTLALVLGIRA